MRTAVKRFYANPRYANIFEWGRLVTITGSAQMIVQAVGLINGILIIRFLPTNQYALYTLANMMLGTMILLADGGITDGVLSQGGKVWKNPQKLGSVINTGLELRKKFTLVSLGIVIPVLFYLLHHHGASLLVATLIVAALIPAFFAALSGTILEVGPKLHQDIKPLQKTQVALNGGRFPLLVISLFLFPWAFVAVFISSLPQIWANTRLRKISRHYVDRSQAVDPKARKEILKIVKRTLPGAIYYSFYGQISGWLISIFGSTEGLAQVGALSRLVMVLNVLSSLFGILIVPRFARLAENRKLLLKRFFQIEGFLILLSAFIVYIVTIFSSQFLFILGKQYASFNTEIIIITASSCIAMVMGITYNISVSRGWILPPVILISGNVIVQVILLYLMDLSKTQNVLWFSVMNNAVAFLMIFVYYIYRAFKFPTQVPTPI